MDYDDFIKKIAFSKEMNPFHASFSIDSLKSFLKDNIDDGEASAQMSAVLFMTISNPLYKEFYRNMMNIFSKKNNHNDYYLYSFSIANHDSLVVFEEIMNKSKEAEIFDFIKIGRSHLDKGPTENSIDNWSDGIGDLLDFNFSMIKFASGNPLQNDVILELNNEYFRYYRQSNLFVVLKIIFEKVCFENAKCDYKDGTLYLRNRDESFEMMKAIAVYRLQSNIMYSFQRLTSNETFMAQLKQQSNFRKRKIESMAIDEQTGELTIEIVECDFNQSLENHYLGALSIVCTYHDYLPDAIRQKLEEFLKLLSILQYIASEINNVVMNKIITDKNESINPNYSLFRIKKDQLLKSIIKFSGMPISNIYNFLNYIMNNGTKSFWIKPMLVSDLHYFFSIPCVLGANIFNFIDTWLNDNDSIYNKKGHDFENYLRREISSLSEGKKFFCKIIETKKFFVLDKNEEIDLLWETKHKIIIAEIKNIRYPFTSRNINEYKKTLEYASEQLIRKSNFIIENKSCFPDLNLSKEVIKCIITNYPFFSGTAINGIPVIDIGILRSYIGLGYNAQVEFTDKPHYKNRIDFYNNEDEYSNRMAGFFMQPEAINAFKSRLQYEEMNYDIINGLKINVLNVVYVS